MKIERLEKATEKLIAGLAAQAKTGTEEELLEAGALVIGSIAINLHRAADALELIAKHLAPVAVEAREGSGSAWIDWPGGATMPLVPPHSVIQVRFRDGEASEITAREAAMLIWQHMESSGDIVAYRVL